eukprot:1162086-Pelagomonas_calceolata.AAC.5
MPFYRWIQSVSLQESPMQGNGTASVVVVAEEASLEHCFKSADIKMRTLPIKHPEHPLFTGPRRPSKYETSHAAAGTAFQSPLVANNTHRVGPLGFHNESAAQTTGQQRQLLFFSLPFWDGRRAVRAGTKRSLACISCV